MFSFKRIRHRIEWLGLAALAKIVPLLSRRGCYRLGGFLGACAVMLDRRGRRIALSNLEAALGNELSSRRRATVVSARILSAVHRRDARFVLVAPSDKRELSRMD